MFCSFVSYIDVRHYEYICLLTVENCCSPQSSRSLWPIVVYCCPLKCPSVFPFDVVLLFASQIQKGLSGIKTPRSTQPSSVTNPKFYINTYNTHLHAHLKHVKMDNFWVPFTHTALRMMSSRKATLRHFGLTPPRSYSNGLFLTPYREPALINPTCFHRLSLPFLACMSRAGLF